MLLLVCYRAGLTRNNPAPCVHMSKFIQDTGDNKNISKSDEFMLQEIMNEPSPSEMKESNTSVNWEALRRRVSKTVNFFTTVTTLSTNQITALTTRLHTSKATRKTTDSDSLSWKKNCNNTDWRRKSSVRCASDRQTSSKLRRPLNTTTVRTHLPAAQTAVGPDPQTTSILVKSQEKMKMMWRFEYFEYFGFFQN